MKTLSASNLVTDSFDSALQRVILLLTIPLLFLPKINLISVTGESAGLRIDDACLLCAAFLCLCGVCYARRPLISTEKLFGCFLFSATLSVGINWLSDAWGILNAKASLLHVLRLAEYFTFFYAGAMLSRHMSAIGLLLGLFAVNATVLILQWFEVIGGFRAEGYQPSVSFQPTGLAAGHWEIGFILNILYAVGLYKFSLNRTTTAAWFLLNLALVIITGGRSAVMGMIAVTCFYTGWRAIVYGAVATTLVVGLIYFADLSQLPLLKRSTHLWNLDNLAEFYRFIFAIDVDSRSFTELYDRFRPLEGADLDMSWFFRIYKWGYVIKYSLIHPFYSLFGLGPGIFGVAVDGGILRLLAEYGLIGTGLFFSMLYRTSQGASVLFACLVAFLVNSLFLDMFLAYKAMSLYFLVLGIFTVNKVTV